MSLARCALAASLTIASAMFSSGPAAAGDGNWVGTWMASPQPIWGADFAFPTKIPVAVRNETFRQVARISLGGSRFRLVFSNAYGDTPLRIGAASVALPVAGSSAAASHRNLAFGATSGIVIPPGAQAVSDPVDLTVADGAQLIVSVWLPDETPLKTFHWDGRASAWFQKGDLTASPLSFPTTGKTDARVLLSEILVDAPNSVAVVAMGDSITDGNGATVDADTRWPDFLAKRLGARRIAVLNAGISGARLLQDKMGSNALARLDRDVLAQPNVKAIILLIGINDIAWPGTAFAREQVRPTIAAMIAGYRQFIALAHARNVRVIGATLTPFEGALSGTLLGNYYSPDKDAVRQEINCWIRQSGAFDDVVDFDRLLRDPAQPARLARIFDSGDHLHPGDAGNKAMAEAISIDALLGGRP